MLIRISGLPAHVLIIHAAVVFTPLAAGVALAYVVLPSWRDRLRMVMAALVGIALLSIVAAYFSGIDFRNSKPFYQQGPIGKAVDTHQYRARLLLVATIPFAVLGFASAWVHTREGTLRLVLNVLLAVAAVAVLVLVFLTGEAGARAVWGNS